MKKVYESPVIEKVSFKYQEQVVASGTRVCEDRWVNIGVGACQTGNQHVERLNQ